MKYFTFEMTITNGQTAIATYERADLDSALSAHYSVMASATAPTSACVEALSMVYDNEGHFYKNEHWMKQETAQE